jgi:uncharacterized tellurite resistance protein B-like protein|tara:strand:+ start:2511 stop:3020 length:510 start_codon:yes stop_codon:yes gene_type:complete
MEGRKFKELLFDIACCSMGCDGHIDDKEIRELKFINSSTSYFKNIDMTNRLESFIENLNENGQELIKSTLDHLKSELLNPVEEMLVLEVVLRLIYSDTMIDEKEISYIQSIRSLLSIDDNILIQRFGEVDFLFSTDQKIISKKEANNKSSKSSDIPNLDNMYAKLGDKK